MEFIDDIFCLERFLYLLAQFLYITVPSHKTLLGVSAMIAETALMNLGSCWTMTPVPGVTVMPAGLSK
jgi:hypothetical protein